MPTRFRKIISGKYFSKMFLPIYILFMGFAAYETNTALCMLTNRSHLYGIVYIIFTVISVLIITKNQILQKRPNRVYKKIFSFLGCFFIYYVLVLISWNLICVITRCSENAKAVGIVMSVAVSAIVVLCGYLHTKNINIKPYTVSIGSGKSEYRISLISDIHLGIFVGEKHVQRIVDKINSIKPDIVVISGDIFDADNSLLDDTTRIDLISKQLCRIKSREGVYAVAGNHDPKTCDERFKRFLKKSKIKLLDNDTKELSKIYLVGRTDAANNERKLFEEIFPTQKHDKPIVVLDHKPENIRENISGGADLVLSGHTHRGQMFPITLLTKLANGKDCFYGNNSVESSRSIITSGVGFFELPMRLGTSNEIADIHLEI